MYRLLTASYLNFNYVKLKLNNQLSNDNPNKRHGNLGNLIINKKIEIKSITTKTKENQ